jgi:nucleotide-binding universal stress UspA family protein
LAEKIVKFSTDEQVDLLVIGSIGLGGISKVKALGSVSQNLMELSKRPILVIH